MASDEFGEKTEDPSDHRRDEQRRQGNIARSSELNIAGHLVVTAGILFGMGSGLVEAIAELLGGMLTAANNGPVDADRVTILALETGKWCATHVLPALMAMLLGAIAVNLLQTGFLATTEKLTPNLQAINPATGLSRILSIRSLVTLLLSLGKMTLLFAVASAFVWHKLPLFIALSTAGVETVVVAIGRSVVELSALLAAILLVIGVADYGFQKWKYEQDIKMTREEVKEETKTMEGDPDIRRRRRMAHQKLIQARDISKVSASTFMLTNPTHYAIAFKYEIPEYPAPTVIAKGVDDIALRMREVAEEHDIPIIERPELARHVYRRLRIGQAIPADLYDVFIELVHYVYAIKGRQQELKNLEKIGSETDPDAL